MLGIQVSVIRFIDADNQPGWVECRLVDAAGAEHFFVEKAPVVSSEDLWTDTVYPRPGVIACSFIGERDGDRMTVTIDTGEPWGVESKEGKTRFEVLRQDLIEF